MSADNMLGPRLPAREDKLHTEAKAKVKHNWPIMTKGYVPDNSSIVHHLPDELTSAAKSSWDKHRGPGSEFASYKGNRGDPGGAAGWIREVYIGEWWDTYYPNAKGASKDDRLWFIKKSKQDKAIWTILNNSLRSSNQKGKVKKRAIGHDAYREESPEAYLAAVEEWTKANGSHPPFDERRKISYSVYTNLPNQRQQDLKEKAIAKVKESRQFARITDPQELAKFTREYRDKMRKLFEYGFERGGIDVCALVVHPTEEGETRVTREITEGIEGFKESTKLAESMAALKEFLEVSNEGPISFIPSPRVYPNLTKDGYPCLPNFEGWSLGRLRKLLRDFFKAAYNYQGGVGRLPWKEIKAAIEYFFNKRRLPKVEGLVFDDPSYLAKEMVVIWLTFFVACSTEIIPPEEQFQFLRIFAGLFPIHSSESQETSREQVERDGKMVYVLVFENKVTKCHLIGGMSYKQPAIDYANHVAFGSVHANATSTPPERWLLLPSASPNALTVAFAGEELGLLTSITPDLPEVAKTRVLTIIEVVNSYQMHLPAMHPLGIWLLEGGIPLVFAQTPQEASRPWTVFWLPPDFFLPPAQARREGTLYFFELCQHELREGGMILHKPSKTFYGGYTGIISMARALIQIYLNCLAVRGDFKPPEAAPTSYDTTRFNVQEHDRIVGWIDEWISAIKQHTEVLSKTSMERKAGLAHVSVRSASKDSDSRSSSDSDSDQEDSLSSTFRGPVPLCSPSPPPPLPLFSTFSTSQPVAGPSKSIANPSKAVVGRSKSVAGYSKPLPSPQPIPTLLQQSKGKPTQFTGCDETEDEDEGVDYDRLDITSQDDKSSDEEWSRFNERFLDDDIFPPDDPIGLGERYGIHPAVNHVFHAACEPYKGVTEEDFWFPNMGEVWGGFPELEPYKAPRLSRPDTIMRQLITIGREATLARHRWEFYNKDNPRFSPGLRRWSKAESSGFSKTIQPLIQLLFTRLMCWLRAKAMMPYVYCHWLAMSYILREAIDLFSTTEHLIRKGNFPNPEFTAQDLIDQVMKTKLQVVGLTFICVELRAWHKLSTEFMKKLQGSWLIRTIPALGSVIEIIDGSLKWIDASKELGEALAEQRPALWAKFLDAPYEAPPVTNYLFGCPTPGEEPDNLEDALHAARKMDPCMEPMDQITKSINEIISSYVDASLASKQPSASHPTPDATNTTRPESRHPPPLQHIPAGKFVVNPAPEDIVPGGQGTDLDIPTLAINTLSTPTLPLGPSASPESGEKRKRPKPKSKPRTMDSPEPQAIASTPVIDPTPIPSATESEPTLPTPVNTVEGAQAMVADPQEDNAETAEASPSVLVDPPLPAPTRTSKSKSKSESKGSVPSLPLPQIPAIPEVRQLRKRKSALETETEKGREKRVSMRLQTKSGPEKVNPKSREEKSERRVSTRASRKH